VVRRDEGEFQSLAPLDAVGDAAGDTVGPRPARDGGRSRARVESGAPDLKPRDLGEILDLALEVFRSRFGIFVGLSTLLWVPVRFAQPFIGLHKWVGPGSWNLPYGAMFGFLFNLLSTAVVSVLVDALVALLVAAHLEGRALSVRDAFQGVLSRSFAVILIAFMTGILTTAGISCFCIPGIFLAWKLYLAPAVCVVEGASVGESLSRSFELCRGRFLPWVALVVVVFCFTSPFTSVGAAADNPNFRDRAIQELGISGAAFDWAAVAFTSLFIGVATAVRGVIVTVWYFDCRARREGIDLAARLQRLRAGSAAVAGAAP
jgi:hypothetical protein